MREIIFKAKRKDNGEWVEGNLITNERNESQKYIGYIFDEHNGVVEDFDLVEVDSNTLCQYTGLTDKHGQKIWENDVAYIRSSGLSGYGIIKYENGNLVLVDSKRKRTYSLYGEWKIRKDGNIFDNAGLLEVE